jgi:hypothetical protein
MNPPFTEKLWPSALKGVRVREYVMVQQCGWGRGCLAALVGGVVLSLVPTLRAEGNLDRLDSSLKLVPADAAFYGAMLRNREQVQAVLKSRAWAKLMALPMVKSGLQMAHAQIHDANGPAAPYVKLLHTPENHELIHLVLDMGSQEIFYYGGDSWLGFIDVAGQLAGAMQFGPALAAIGKGATGDNPARTQARLIFSTLAKNIDLLKVPDLVVGFKLSDTARAETQLGRLEKLLTGLLERIPQLKNSLKRAKVAGGDFLVLSLDGSMVPWDQLSIRDREDDSGEYEDLVKKLNGLKLTVHLGVRDNYLLLALGDSAAGLERLGKSERLADRSEFKPLARFADRRVSSIQYLSRALAAKVGTSKKDIDGIIDFANKALKQTGFPDETQERIRKDLDALSRDLKSLIAEPGASMAFSFLTDRGQESYSYEWGDHPGLDASKPLTVLNHVGGTPICAGAGRSRYRPDRYLMLVKWIKTFHGYFEELVLPLVGETNKEKYDEAVKAFFPLLKRLDETTAKKLLPGFADSQFALALDGRLKSRQWYKAMPPAKDPLPMLEPALVFGVSDASLVKQAFADYRGIVNDLITEVRKLGVPQVPEFEIPEATTLEVKSGTLYYYPVPILGMLGIDTQIVPTAGLNDKVLVLTLSQAHAGRLLTPMPLKKTEGPLADPDRPLAGAAYVDWPALVDTVAPWVDYGGEFAARHSATDSSGKKPPDIKALLEQAHVVLDVLKVLRSYTSGTYLEDGALVTHGETVLQDL